MAFTFDFIAALLLLILGAWSILAQRMMTAVIGFMIYGLILSLIWVRLYAIDVALTETAIGSGATGMLLISAAHRVAREEPHVVPMGSTMRVFAGILAATVAIGLASLAFVLPGEPVSLADQVMARLPESGLGNPVAGVLFVFRAFDTLLEKIVLLLALLGVWSLSKDEAWGGIPGLRRFTRTHSVMFLLARVLPPIGVVYAIYMTWVGADVPGGAFQGSTVLAAMWVLVLVAGIWRAPPLSSPLLRAAVVAGPVVFLAIGFAGQAMAGSFLAYPEGLAKPLIVFMEFALTLSIGVILGLLIAGPAEAEKMP